MNGAGYSHSNAETWPQSQRPSTLHAIEAQSSWATPGDGSSTAPPTLTTHGNECRKKLEDMIRLKEKGYAHASALNEILELVVMDDKKAFENASVKDIRRHFGSWVKSRGKSSCDSTMYEICLVVDEAAMQSILFAVTWDQDLSSDGPATGWESAWVLAVDGRDDDEDPDFERDEEGHGYRGEMKASVYFLFDLYLGDLNQGMEQVWMHSRPQLKFRGLGAMWP